MEKEEKYFFYSLPVGAATLLSKTHVVRDQAFAGWYPKVPGVTALKRCQIETRLASAHNDTLSQPEFANYAK